MAKSKEVQLTFALMSDDKHLVADRFNFAAPRNTGVLICARVRGGAPILYAAHENNGDWQFLCGAEHSDASTDPPSLACLECTVALDQSLNDLADMCEGWYAERKRPGAKWIRHDTHEDFIRDAVEKYGWAVQLIAAGGEKEPAFAYTVGLYRSYGHAELITIGLKRDVMHAMLNACGERIRAGEQLPVGTPFGGILENYSVALRQVRSLKSFRDHVGYAGWFNQGWKFPLLQLIWPDKNGRFPGEPGAEPTLAGQQPLLP